jgi:two-component system chemotaxis response regulator CheB
MNNPMTKIRVLIVDDSMFMRELITFVLESDPGIEVITAVKNGKEALSIVKSEHPDVVTMDYHMPEMNGPEATRKIMEEHPVPVIIMSSTAMRDEMINAFNLMDVGAVAVIGKPVATEHEAYDKQARELVQLVKAMSEVKVVRRWPKRVNSVSLPVRDWSHKKHNGNIKLVAIGASTGGPVVIKTILSNLPSDFPAPILIVQHIAQGFTPCLVDWLKQVTRFSVQVAEPEVIPLPHHAYVAPDGYQMLLQKNGCIGLKKMDSVNGHCPSVSVLFHSVAEVLGPAAVGVLLTGMGKDGAAELKLLKNAGAVTIAQDKVTSVVYGMPGEAMLLGAVDYSLPPEEIASTLCSLVIDGVIK